MKCEYCKKEDMVESRHTYFAELKNCYVIIENVPCLKCESCGEIYYRTSVLEKIEELLAKVENIASKIFIMDYEKHEKQIVADGETVKKASGSLLGRNKKVYEELAK